MRTRAIIIGLMGPSIGAVGFFWLLIKTLAESSHSSATFRYFIFDPPHLLMLVGIAVSALSLPIALEVSQANSEDVEISIFDEELALEDETPTPLPDGLGGVALSAKGTAGSEVIEERYNLG